MLHRILKSFLQHSEHAKRNVVWQAYEAATGVKDYLYIALLRQLLAEALGRASQPEILQLGGVQTMRETLHILAYICDALNRMPDMSKEIGIGKGRDLLTPSF
jgi:hypothetical protein